MFYFILFPHRYVSARNIDAILKIRVNFEAEEEDRYQIVWILGGPFGEFQLANEKGAGSLPGTSLWNHQHNAEMTADGHVIMFDNGNQGGGKDIL